MIFYISMISNKELDRKTPRGVTLWCSDSANHPTIPVLTRPDPGVDTEDRILERKWTRQFLLSNPWSKIRVEIHYNTPIKTIGLFLLLATRPPSPATVAWCFGIGLLSFLLSFYFLSPINKPWLKEKKKKKKKRDLLSRQGMGEITCIYCFPSFSLNFTEPVQL